MGYALILLLIAGWLIIRWLRLHPEILQRWLMRRVAKRFAQQAARQQQHSQAAASQRSYRRSRQSSAPSGRRKPLIPPEYAEDVDFTETRIYTSDTTIDTATGAGEVKVESQVSDVKWVDIKTKKK